MAVVRKVIFSFCYFVDALIPFFLVRVDQLEQQRSASTDASTACNMRDGVQWCEPILTEELLDVVEAAVAEGREGRHSRGRKSFPTMDSSTDDFPALCPPTV